MELWHYVLLGAIGLFNVLLAWSLGSLTYRGRDTSARLRACELTLAGHYTSGEVRAEITSALKPFYKQLEEQREDWKSTNNLLLQLIREAHAK